MTLNTCYKKTGGRTGGGRTEDFKIFTGSGQQHYISVHWRDTTGGTGKDACRVPRLFDMKLLGRSC